MRAVLALLLIMLALTIGFVWTPQDDVERGLAVVTAIVPHGSPNTGSPAVDPPSRGLRTFSPQTALLATVEPANPRGATCTVNVARVAGPLLSETPLTTQGRAGVLGNTPVGSGALATGGAASA